jgi:hypothetical protein
MDKSFFLNRRVITFLLLFISFLVLVCFGLYTIGRPKFDLVATATLARGTDIADTATIEVLSVTQFAESTLISQSQTQTAMPTSTPLPTVTMTETPTPFVEGCPVKLKPGALLYRGPSFAFSDFRLLDDTQLLYYADVKNLDWTKVSTKQSDFAWVQKGALNVNDCSIQSLPLSFLMGWDINRHLVLEENFSAINDWVYKPLDEAISPIRPSGSDFQTLRLGKERDDTESSLREPFGYFNDFSLYTSFLWIRNGKFGIRFWSDGVNFYEVMINPNCEVEIYDSGELLIKRQIVTDKACFNQGVSESASYFEINVKDNQLSFKLNEADPIVYSLKNAYMGENITLVTKSSIVNMEYFVFTTGK